MTAHVPRIAATGSYRRSIRHIRFIVAARCHLPARSHVEKVAGEVVPPWAGLAEGGQCTHDQRRVLFPKRLETESQRRQEAWPKGLQNDVRIRRQTPEKLAPIRGFQIERNAALGCVVVPKGETALRMMDVVEEWPDMAIALATGWFDLDDVSPEVAKKLAAELALFIRKLQDS